MSDFKSYKDLDIYTISLDLFLKVHPKTLQLPKYELYELGSQLRRSSDSVVSNILKAIVGGGTKLILFVFWFFPIRVV
jgi:hypothetical protein